jgi:prepilin-type N-terminal cleavage/methylation domain-containing protein
MSMNTNRPSPRSGFSLVEMMIAITVAGLLLAIATPKVRATVIHSEVKSARAAVASLFTRARIHALQTRRAAVVNFNTTRGWVVSPDGAGGIDTVGAVLDLSNAYGVAIDASTAIVRFQPTGLTTSPGTVTVRVTRSSKTDSVVVSGYGRLQ